MGEANWKVDAQRPKKILTVTTENLNDEEVIKALEKAGYKVEKLFKRQIKYSGRIFDSF